MPAQQKITEKFRRAFPGKHRWQQSGEGEEKGVQLEESKRRSRHNNKKESEGKKATTEQNESEEGWKEERGGNEHFGKEVHLGRKKHATLKSISDLTAQSIRAAPGMGQTATLEEHLGFCTNHESNRAVVWGSTAPYGAEQGCQRTPCHSKGKPNPNSERLLMSSQVDDCTDVGSGSRINLNQESLEVRGRENRREKQRSAFLDLHFASSTYWVCCNDF